MTEHTLENDILLARVNSLGAELRSVIRKADGEEFLWQGGSTRWKASAPNLFPFVGACRGNRYEYADKFYDMPKHGFARNSEFEMIDSGPGQVTFRLTESEKTLAVYPFRFSVTIGYRLSGAGIATSYEVENRDDKEIYFGLGGHPGFNLPGYPGSGQTYHLEFGQTEGARPFRAANGLIFDQPDPRFCLDRILDIGPATFDTDAHIYMNIKSREVSLKNSAGATRLIFRWSGFPHFAVWAVAGAPYVCLEPWLGHADKAGYPEKLSDKPQLKHLKPGENFQADFSISVT